MFNYSDPHAIGHTYSEKDWNPVTMEIATTSPRHGYLASKTFAEKAAWTFCEDEKPDFSIAVINPPMVFGPIIHSINSLDAINTSNRIIRDMIQGRITDNLPPSGIFLWVDVRDVALAHVKAMEVPEAGGKRFFLVAGYFSNKKIVEVICKAYPELEDKLPSKSVEDDFPSQIFAIDHSRSEQILGIEYRFFNTAIIDTVKSLQEVGAEGRV
jgi:nucleoside-diphosphate-sugar epimerase